MCKKDITLKRKFYIKFWEGTYVDDDGWRRPNYEVAIPFCSIKCKKKSELFVIRKK